MHYVRAGEDEVNSQRLVVVLGVQVGNADEFFSKALNCTVSPPALGRSKVWRAAICLEIKITFSVRKYISESDVSPFGIQNAAAQSTTACTGFLAAESGYAKNKQ